MAWTTPITAVDSTAFTAAQFNASVRDNLLETMPAKATTPGSYFATVGNNSIIERFPYTNAVAAAQTTTSTAYTDLTTVGPTLSNIEVGNSALIFLSADVTTTSSTAFALMSFTITGDVTFTPTDDSVSYGIQGNVLRKFGNSFRLILGSSATVTITAKYRTTAGTATFGNRSITLINF